MATLNFDASTVAPQASYPVIPAGFYLAQATESELKPTKSGTGMILNLKFTILDGQYAGRHVFGRINVQNQNEVAQNIGQAQLSQLCHSVGVIKMQDSAQIHNRPVKIKVKVTPAQGQWEEKNEVTAFEAAGGSMPAPQQGFAPQPAPFQQQPAPFAPQSNNAPWARAA